VPVREIAERGCSWGASRCGNSVVSGAVANPGADAGPPNFLFFGWELRPGRAVGELLTIAIAPQFGAEEVL
jgi:hypothetical protein